MMRKRTALTMTMNYLLAYLQLMVSITQEGDGDEVSKAEKGNRGAKRLIRFQREIEDIDKELERLYKKY